MVKVYQNSGAALNLLTPTATSDGTVVTITRIDTASASSVASGGSGHIQLSNGSGGFMHDANAIVWDSTNNRLGVNTASPAYSIDTTASGTVRAATFTGALTGTADVATAVTLYGSGNVTYYPTFVDATSGDENMRVDSDWTYNASTNKMTVGNIAVSTTIGHTSDVDLLTLASGALTISGGVVVDSFNNAATRDNIRFKSQRTTGNATYLRIGRYGTGDDGSMFIGNNYNRNSGFAADNTSVGVSAVKFDTDGSINFQTAAAGTAQPTEKMTIEPNGNVGIGTASPYNLTNYTFLSINHATNGGGMVMMDNGTRIGAIYNAVNTVYLDALADIAIRTGSNPPAGTDRMRITAAGNVGIGETIPANLLHVKVDDTGINPHASAQIVLERDGTNYLQFLTGNDGTSGILFGDEDDNDVSKIYYDHNTKSMHFAVETDIVMTIDGDVGDRRVTFGDFNDEQTTEGLIYINPNTHTVGANRPFHYMYLSNNNVITIPSGTASLVTGINIEAPNITATGTVTNTATMRIAGAMTEGSTGNYSLLVAGGTSWLDGMVLIGQGTATGFATGADNLIVGDGANHEGMTIFTGNDSIGSISFADAADPDGYSGYIQYGHGTQGENMTFGTAGSPAVNIDNTQTLHANLLGPRTGDYMYLRTDGNNTRANIRMADGDTAVQINNASQYGTLTLGSYRASATHTSAITIKMDEDKKAMVGIGSHTNPTASGLGIANGEAFQQGINRKFHQYLSSAAASGYILIGYLRPGKSWSSGLGVKITLTDTYYNGRQNRSVYQIHRNSTSTTHEDNTCEAFCVESSGYNPIREGGIFIKNSTTYNGVAGVTEIYALLDAYGAYTIEWEMQRGSVYEKITETISDAQQTVDLLEIRLAGTGLSVDTHGSTSQPASTTASLESTVIATPISSARVKLGIGESQPLDALQITQSGRYADIRLKRTTSNTAEWQIQAGFDRIEFVDWSTSSGVVDFMFEADGDFHANGDVYAFSGSVASDIALKSNVNIIDKALDKVSKLRGVSFDWKNSNKGSSAGLIAQDVEEILPELVTDVKNMNDDTTHKSLNYNGIIGLLVESIKELKDEIAELKNGNQ